MDGIELDIFHGGKLWLQKFSYFLKIKIWLRYNIYIYLLGNFLIFNIQRRIQKRQEVAWTTRTHHQHTAGYHAIPTHQIECNSHSTSMHVHSHFTSDVHLNNRGMLPAPGHRGFFVCTLHALSRRRGREGNGLYFFCLFK